MGKDLRPIERHWNVMLRANHFTGGAINGAVWAIDIALWDIKGKLYGVPVYELLGGQMRHKARLYGHVKGRTAKTLIEEAIRLKAEGFTVIGHLNPLLDEDETTPFYKSHASRIEAIATGLDEQQGDFIKIPGAPGIGVELVPDAEKKFPYRPRPIRMRPHVDGSVVDM